MCITKYLISVNPCTAHVSTKRDTRSLSYFVSNTIFRLQMAQFSATSTHRRRPVVNTTGLYPESLGFKPGNRICRQVFPCFFSGPTAKPWWSRRFALRPLLGTINPTVRRHSSARQRHQIKKNADLETSKFCAITQVSISITNNKRMWQRHEHWFLHKDNKLHLHLPNGVGFKFWYTVYEKRKYCLNRKKNQIVK
jgi:hypothetical protein